MNVLVLNCGSATLKFRLFSTSEAGRPRRLADGSVDGIGGAEPGRFSVTPESRRIPEHALQDHGDAARAVLRWLADSGFCPPGTPLAVGHRVVHGGHRFSEPVLIDDDVLLQIADLSRLAPLHNRPSLEAILAAQTELGADVPMVAVFDTAFHRTLPPHAARYAIPIELAAKHRIRRYGFHGIAHRSLRDGAAALLGRPAAELRLITLQLGNGCSAAAIRYGESVDTTMGFTPLEGLMMGTRSGDIDPALVGFLARKEQISVAEVEQILNSRSGLLGISGTSRDMRELLTAADKGHPRAQLAVDMFCYRVRKCVGAYLAVLGGADAVVFGGGIGENAPAVRARICAGMEWCGLTLDESANGAASGTAARINREGSAMAACVVPVDEAEIIATETAQVVRKALSV